MKYYSKFSLPKDLLVRSINVTALKCFKIGTSLYSKVKSIFHLTSTSNTITLF